MALRQCRKATQFIAVRNIKKKPRSALSTHHFDELSAIVVSVETLGQKNTIARIKVTSCDDVFGGSNESHEEPRDPCDRKKSWGAHARKEVEHYGEYEEAHGLLAEKGVGSLG